MPTNSISLSRLLLAERRSLLRQVRRLMGSDGAEDVAQKVWFKVQAIRDDPPILDKEAYLRRLAHNVAVDHVQSQLQAVSTKFAPVPEVPETQDALTMVCRHAMREVQPRSG